MTEREVVLLCPRVGITLKGGDGVETVTQADCLVYVRNSFTVTLFKKAVGGDCLEALVYTEVVIIW